MQNMDSYYDFSGQKFGYPLSLSINSFSRSVFSRQSSLEISYVLKGEYEALTPSFSETLKEHEMIVIAPYEIHMLKKKEGFEDSIILTLHIDFARMSDSMVGDARESFQSAICSEERNRESFIKLRELLSSLVSLLMDEKDDIYTMNVIMMEMMLVASKKRNFSMEELPLRTDQHENYIKAVKWIDEHYREDITLSSIADQLSFSLSYASKTMKKYTGLPFVKYLSFVRVRASLESLLEGRDSIEKIADEVGMPSAKAYSSSFRELYGISPSQYRKIFQSNVRYGDGTPEKMKMEKVHRELLSHLTETRVTSLEGSRIEVTEKGDEYLLRLPDSSITVDKDEEGNLLLKIRKKK